MIRIDNIEYDDYKKEICFHQNKNSKYTLAYIQFNCAEDEFDVCSVGKRCFELSEDDYDDFKTVLDLIEKKMYRKRNED